MGRGFAGSSRGGEWYLEGPYQVVYVALGLTLASALLGLVPGSVGTFLCVLFLVAGLLAAGGAVWWRLSSTLDDDFEERCKSGIVVALASGCVLFTYLAMRESWDSMRLFVSVLWVVSMVAVPVLILPSVGRRVVLSLLVLFHFGGVLAAVTAVGLRNSPPPWLPTLIWNKVYRNYLYFAYLNNAYHFYSPEPGPPTLVWFLVEFDDGSKEWIRLVRREDIPTRQQYQRLLSLTESINSPVMTPYQKLEALWRRRRAVVILPMNEFLNTEAQYREPSDLAKKYLSSYASYVIRTAKHPTNPDAKPTSVKIYRLIHHLIGPAQLASGLSPKDPTLFHAFFQGEYNEKGELLQNINPELEQEKSITWLERLPDGSVQKHEDPLQDRLLYWMLPIERRPKIGITNPKEPKDYTLMDTLSIHAGKQVPWDED